MLDNHLFDRRDIDDVLRIEEEAQEEPFDKDDFYSLLSEPNVVCKVVTQDEVPVGFMIFERNNEMIILQHLSAVNDGLLMLLAYMVSDLKKMLRGNRKCVRATVREHDLPMQMALKELGFKYASTWPAFFTDTEEDGYAFELRAQVVK